jgi:hypothetical protein
MSHWRKRNPTASQFNASLLDGLSDFLSYSEPSSRSRFTGTSEIRHDARLLARKCGPISRADLPV